MPKAKRFARYAGIALAIFVPYYLFVPALYIGEPLSGQVVDSLTLEPVSEVVVQIYCDVWHPTWNMGSKTVALHQARAVTDKNGRFEFPKWGPEPAFRWYQLSSDEMGTSFIKPGYKVRFGGRGGGTYLESETTRPPIFFPRTIGASWNGKRIRIAADGIPDVGVNGDVMGGDPY